LGADATGGADACGGATGVALVLIAAGWTFACGAITTGCAATAGMGIEPLP
jgi:hypothetical protein